MILIFMTENDIDTVVETKTDNLVDFKNQCLEYIDYFCNLNKCESIKEKVVNKIYKDIEDSKLSIDHDEIYLNLFQSIDDIGVENDVDISSETLTFETWGIDQRHFKHRKFISFIAN